MLSLIFWICIQVIQVTELQDGQTRAFYTWKQGASSVSINGLELRSNQVTSRIANLMQEKTRQSELSLVDNAATGAYSDGTGSGSKQLTGLEAICATDPTTGTFASINSANNTAWRNQVTTGVGAAAVNLIPNLRTLFNDCSQGKDGASSKPNAIFTTQAIHESYEALIEPRVRFTPNPSGGADTGIDDLLYKNASVKWDDFCTSGNVYVVNSQHLMLFVHKDANFKMIEEGFQRPIDQDALVTQVLFQGNMATNNRRKLGKLTGVT